MSNPDSKISIYTGSIGAIIVTLITGFITIYFSNTTYFIYLLFFVVIFVVFFGSIIISWSYKGADLDLGNAFKGAGISVGFVFIGLVISSISYCRLPITSLFSSYYGNADIQVQPSNNTHQQCCMSSVKFLEVIEKEYSGIKGFSYAFYLFFFSIYGFIIGGNIGIR